MTTQPHPNKLRRRLERALLVAGTAGVTVWLCHLTMFTVGQSWDNWVFERQSRGETATVQAYVNEQRHKITDEVRSWLGLAPPARRPLPQRGGLVPPPAPSGNQLIGRLSIPRLQVKTTVREGTSERTLSLATGHIRGTTLPGQNGNVGVAGHRDTFFQGLADIRLSDVVEFETRDARYGYEVVSTDVVRPDAVEVLRPGRYPELTLVTCYPFDYIGSAPERFIVKARQVSQTPLRRRMSEAPPPPPPSAPPEIRPAALPEAPPGKGRVPFHISRHHSGQVVPGISVGVTEVDAAERRVDGWVWVMPDRRTLWLRGHPPKEPLVFYQDGERRQLVIASVTSEAASGYLLMR